jgi:hypothetical protein
MWLIGTARRIPTGEWRLRLNESVSKLQFHDAYRISTTQNVSYAAAGGVSAQSNAFGSQTRFIRVLAVGLVSASIDGVRIAIDTSPTASATTALIAVNFPEVFKVSPGQKIAVLGNNTGTGTVNVTELTD